MQGLTALTHVGVRSLSLHCRGLVALDVGYCTCIDDLCVRVIAAGLWGLQSLSLAGLKVTPPPQQLPRSFAFTLLPRRLLTLPLANSHRAATTSPTSICRPRPGCRTSASRRWRATALV